MKIVCRTRKEVLRRWVKALRSGEYEQSHGCLRTDFRGKSFCSLGVLCDLAAKDGGAKWERFGDAHYYRKSATSLPDVMVKFLDLRGHMFNLVEMNDYLKWNFKQIAGYIEKELL